MEELINAHKSMMRRYRSIIINYNLEDKEYLIKFCDAAQTLRNPDKLSRWVGYIQGILIDRTIIDTNFERDISRELYKPIYEKLGYDTTSVNVNENNTKCGICKQWMEPWQKCEDTDSCSYYDH